MGLWILNSESNDFYNFHDRCTSSDIFFLNLIAIYFIMNNTISSRYLDKSSALWKHSLRMSWGSAIVNTIHSKIRRRVLLSIFKRTRAFRNDTSVHFKYVFFPISFYHCNQITFIFVTSILIFSIKLLTITILN